MTNRLLNFLNSSYTAYHATENAKRILLDNGFTPLLETETWNLQKNGKYFVERGNSALLAFTVGKLDVCSFKIIASHTDSPALKIKENHIMKTEAYAKLNVEKYGGGIFYSFFDRKLKIAGRIITEDNNVISAENVVSDYSLTIPSVAIHLNRNVNEGLASNPQTDLTPLFSFVENAQGEFIQTITDKNVLSYDLYLVNGDCSYEYGINNEFVAAPRVDNLSSVYSTLEALISNENNNGICVGAFFDSEEIGNLTLQGSDSDFLSNILKRICFAFNQTEEEYFKALANSFMLSLDVAHAVHPNHPEKHDPTNRATLGGGVVIKYAANGAYVTNGMSAAVVKHVFNNANVNYQVFFNRSDMPGGSTLGRSSLAHASIQSVDIGLPILAMHSLTDSFAKKDYEELIKALNAFYCADIQFNNGSFKIR